MEKEDIESFKKDQENDKKVQYIIDNIKPYQEGDPVDLYLKNRGIKQYSNDCYILTTDKYSCLVNLCYKTIYSQASKWNDEKYTLTGSISGLQQIYLTKEGLKRPTTDNIPNKIQRKFTPPKEHKLHDGYGIAGNPVRLSAKGVNNGYIYVTEGIENGLSIQEYINNEVWCALSISNIPSLPFENDKVYVFVFDNDYKSEVVFNGYPKNNKSQENNYNKILFNSKEAQDQYIKEAQEMGLEIPEDIIKPTEKEKPKTKGRIDQHSEIIDRQQTLNELKVNYQIIADEQGHKALKYNNGDYNFKLCLSRLKQQKNKHFLFLLPAKEGADANDLLKDGKLKDLLNQTPKAIEIEHILKQNKRAKTYQGWRPTKQPNTPDNDNLTPTFIGLQYDSMGLARRFLTRYGNQYKKVDGLGIVKQNKGIWEVNKQDELFNDIQNTILATVYEWDYLTDPLLQESFKKLWIKKGVGEYKTISQVEEYVKRLYELNISIEEFDKETDNIINLKNGYFDLDKMELLEHNDSKLFLRQLNINYNQDAEFKNSDWEKFLLTTFCNKIDGDYRNDKEGMNKIHFLQKAMGYTFSTSIAEEKLFIIKGVTRSGKNTFLDTIQEVMGDYCGNMQDEEFITSKEQNSNYLLSIRASLKGKRFLHISEIGKNRKLNGSQIKRLTGNRRITAKYMHQNSFSYKQQCKYWIATNNIDFTEFDESIKTKLMIIDFNKRFYEQNTNEAKATGRVIDKTLKDRLITDKNKEIILNWIIQGYWMYKQEGLEQTEEMKETLDEIERDNDSLGMFIKDCMETTVEETATYKTAKKTAKEIYEYYRTYEKDNYSTPEDMIMGYRKFVKNIRARGYSVKKLWCRSEASMEIYITDLKSKGEFIINNNIGE